jgi:hypothetical protein
VESNILRKMGPSLWSVKKDHVVSTIWNGNWRNILSYALLANLVGSDNLLAKDTGKVVLSRASRECGVVSWILLGFVRNYETSNSLELYSSEVPGTCNSGFSYFRKCWKNPKIRWDEPNFRVPPMYLSARGGVYFE